VSSLDVGRRKNDEGCCERVEKHSRQLSINQAKKEKSRGVDPAINKTAELIREFHAARAETATDIWKTLEKNLCWSAGKKM